jgi:hypothetical protein
MAYCTREDVIDRVSGAGLVYAADDDGDGVAGSLELLALDRSIEAASAEIDLAVAPFASIESATSNIWLKHRAVDLASERIAARKGQVVPTSLLEAARRSRQWLDEVRRGDRRVPGLAYANAPTTTTVGTIAGRPRIVNPRPGNHEE